MPALAFGRAAITSAACASTTSRAAPITSTARDVIVTPRGRFDEWQRGAGKVADVSTLGLLLNLVGVIILFLFGMPFRIASSGKALTWTMSNIDLQTKKLDDLNSVLGWIGLAAIVLGTLLQILGTPKRQ